MYIADTCRFYRYICDNYIIDILYYTNLKQGVSIFLYIIIAFEFELKLKCKGKTILVHIADECMKET